MTTLGLGLVGPSDRLERRVALWQTVDGVSVTAVAPTDGVSPAVDTTTVETVPALVDTGKVDALDCVTAPARTREIALEAIEQDVPVLLPWPVAESVGDASAVADAATEADCLVLPTLTSRFAPPRVRAKARVDSGALGSAGNVRAAHRYQQESVDGEDEDCDDGELLAALGVELDFLQWVCGDLVRVFVRRAGIPAAVVTGRFADDTVLHVTVREAGTSGYGFELAGDEGLVEFDTTDSPGVSTSNGAVPVGEVDPLRRVLVHFRECVVGDAEPRVTVAEAADVLRIARAALDSETTNEPVSIDTTQAND